MRHAVKEFLDVYIGVYADTTFREYTRRYARLCTIMEELKAEGKVSTLDPAKMIPEDVLALSTYLRKVRRVRPASLQHDIGALQSLLVFHGNESVRFARAKYPQAFPKEQKARLPVLESDDFRKVLFHAEKASDEDLRAFSIVAFAFGTGLRPCEMRGCLVSDVSIRDRTVYVRRPKGTETWATPRHVPIRPECLGIISRWIVVRGGLSDQPLFPSRSGCALSENSFREERVKVNEISGVLFDFRMCRRTYGQYLLDEGYTLDYVSSLLGHTNETTTARFYGRVRPDRVVKTVVKQWFPEGSENSAIEDMNSDCWRKNDGARDGI